MTSAIHTNMQSVRAHNVFEQNNVNMSKAMNNVTTGLRINSVQDSPSNWAISEKMRERTNSLNQAQQNIQNDTAMMKTAEGGMTKTVEILSTLKERALAAADDSLTDSDRVNVGKEMLSLLAQIDENAYSTRYNGKLLIAPLEADSVDTGDPDKADDGTGTPQTLTFQVGDDSNAVISNVTLQNMTVNGLGLGDVQAALAPITTAGSELTSDDLVNAGLKRNIADDGTIDTDTGVDKLISDLQTAFETATAAVADVGSFENRLGYTADNVATQIENLEASDSAIRDADLAKEVSQYMKWSVLSQASQYMIAQANQIPYGVLNLLQ